MPVVAAKKATAKKNTRFMNDMVLVFVAKLVKKTETTLETFSNDTIQLVFETNTICAKAFTFLSSVPCG